MTRNAAIATGLPRRRRWRRFPFTLPLRITIERHRQLSVIHSRSSEVNAGGLCFFAEANLFMEADIAVGDRAEITLTDYDLTLRGVIRNRAGDHCGLQFLAVSPEHAKHLGLFRQILSEKVGRLHA